MARTARPRSAGPTAGASGAKASGGRLLAVLLPAACIVGAALVAMFDPALHVELTLLASGAVAALLGAVGVGFGALDRERATASLVLLAALAWPLIQGIRAASPAVAFLHGSGLAVWLSMWAAFATSMALADDEHAWTIPAAIAIVAAVAAGWALLQVAGVVPLPGGAGSEPMGFLDSSISLGELVLLGSIAAAQWFEYGPKSRLSRSVAVAAGVLCVAGLYVSRARSAWIAFAFAAVVLAVRAFVKPREGSPSAWKLVLAAGAALVAVAYGLVLAVSAGWMGRGVYDKLEALFTNRPEIWRNAMLHIARAPLTGVGAGQFTSVWRWSGSASGVADWQIADDPHSIILWFGIAGGVIGIAIAAACCVWAVRLIRRSSWVGSKAAAESDIVGVGLVALVVALLFGWVNPLTGLCAAILGGSVLRTSGKPATAARREPLTLAVCGVALAVGVGVFIAALHPYLVGRGAEQARAAGSAQYEAYVLDHAHDQDPAWSAKAIDVLVQRGLQNRAAAVVAVQQSDAEFVPTTTRAAQWNSQSVGSLIELETLRQYLQPKANLSGLDAAATLGEHSDPVTGFWRFWVGSVALQFKQPALALQWARESLAKEPSTAADQVANQAQKPASQ